MQLSLNKEPADYPKLHKAVLSGLLSQIGQKTEDGDYLGRTPAALLDSPVFGHRQESAAMADDRRTGGNHQALTRGRWRR